MDARISNRFALLADVTTRLLAAENPQAIIEDLCAEVLAQLDCDVFFNYLVDERAWCLRLNSWAGLPAEAAQDIAELQFGMHLCGAAAAEGRIIVSTHIQSGTDPRAALIATFGVQAFAAHPLLGPEGKVLGTLSFGTRTHETFSETDLETMRLVSDQVAVAVLRQQSEAGLRASEERYRLLVEQAEDGIFVSDTQGRYLDVNSAGARMLGYTREEILRRSMFDVIELHDYPRVMPEIARFEGGRPVLSKWKFRRKDGSGFPGEVLGRLLPDGRLQTILRDVSARESEQQQSAARLGVTQVLERADTPEEAAPKIAEQIGTALGWEAAEFWMARPPTGQLARIAFWQAPGPEPASPGISDRSSEFEGGDGLPGRVLEVGNPIWIDAKMVAEPYPQLRYARSVGIRCCFAFPVKLGAKSMGAIVLSSLKDQERDPTLFKTAEIIGSQIGQFVGRKRAETEVERLNQELRQRVSELETLFDTVPVGLAITDDPQAGRIRGNAPMALMTGIATSAELSQQTPLRPPYRVLYEGRELSLDELPMQRAARGEAVIGQVVQVVQPDGTTSTLISTAKPLLGEDGSPRGALGAFLDITQLRAAEDARLQSEERYRHLFEAMDEGFALHAVVRDGAGRPIDYRFLEVNPSFERITGLHAAEVEGRTVCEVLPKTGSDLLEHFAAVALSGTPRNFESFHAGLERWLNVQAFRPAPDRVAAVFSDITERKRAEAALRESEAKYRNLFENMAEEVHFWKLVRDSEGRIQTWRLVDANPPALKTWGRRSIEEIVGQTADEIFPGTTEHYMPMVQKIMTESVPCFYEDYFPALDKHFRFTSVPFGEYFITTGADISDIKKAEQALRQSREDLARAQEVGEIGWWRLDTRQNVLTWSEENYRIFGVPPSVPQTYETFLQAVHSEDREQVRASWVAALRGEPYDIEHRILVAGQVKWVREKAYLEFDAAGELAGGFGITQDITERVRAGQEIEHRAQEYRELVENASDGIVLVDATGRLVAANACACEILGYPSQEDLCKLCLADLLPPEEIRALKPHLTADLGQRSTIVAHRARRADGEWIHLETNVRSLADGRYQAILRDVSERKRTEEEFRQAVAAHAVDRLFSMLHEFQHGEGLAMNLNRIALFAKNVPLLQSESAKTTATSDANAGDTLQASARVRLEVAAREYKTIGYQTLVNIAALLAAVEREVDANAAPGDEIANGAEIRALAEHLGTDLEALLASLGRDPSPDPEQQAGVVGERIAKQVENLQRKLAALTKQLRGLYTADLSAVAGTIVHSFQPAPADVRISLEDHGPGLRGLISPTDFSDLLRLLLVNSMEAIAVSASAAGGPPGHIVVRLRAAGEAAIVEVEDTGPGVPAEFRPRIFEGGFSTKGAGRGQGLAFAVEHVAKYGGRLSYDDGHEGGARFRIDLVRV